MFRWSLITALASLLPSCAIFFPAPEFRSTSDEQCLRIVSAEDAFEWIEVEHGLCQLQDDAPDQLRTVLAGKRVFPAGGGFPAFDFDSISVNGDSPQWKMFFEFLAGLRVVEARLVLDTNGDPTLWRRLRIEHLSDWLNACHQAQLDDSSDSPWFPANGETLPAFDAATLELMRQARNSGHRPWSVRDGRLVFEIPASQEYADLCCGALIAANDAEHDALRSAEIFDGATLRLEFPAFSSPWAPGFCSRWSPMFDPIPKESMKTADDHGSSVQSSLESRGLHFEPTATYVQLRALFGSP